MDKALSIVGEYKYEIDSLRSHIGVMQELVTSREVEDK